MPRTVNASTITALESDSVRMCHLLQIDFATTLYLTDNYFDVDYDGNTFDAASHFLSIDSTQETQDLRVGSMTINISGVDQSYLSIFLNQEYINRRCQIWLAILDSSGSIVGDPIKTFDGQIVGYSLQESRETSVINMKVASHWADFERSAGRLSNNTSQQQYFSGDTGFRFAAKISRDIKWGKA